MLLPEPFPPVSLSRVGLGNLPNQASQRCDVSNLFRFELPESSQILLGDVGLFEKTVDLIHPQGTHPLLARQSAALSTDNGTLTATTKLFVRSMTTTDATISSHQEEHRWCDGTTRCCLGRRHQL